MRSEIATELEGALEMEAGDRFGATGACHLLRDRLVQISPQCLRHRLVDRVADQRVRESEALFACAVGQEEAAPHQVEQPSLRSVALSGPDEAEYVLEREAASDHCSTLKHLPLLGVEAVEPRLQDGADRGGQRRAASGLERERRDLFDEQRVALRELPNRVPQLRGSAERVDEPPRVGKGERLEHRRSPGRPQPLRAPLRQLWSPDAHDKHSGSVQPRREVLDQVEHRLLGPVHVVERDDDRLLGGDLHEQSACRREDLVAGDFERVLVATGRAEDLPHGRERHALAVRRAASDQDDRLRCHVPEEFLHKPRLADARLAEHGQ